MNNYETICPGCFEDKGNIGKCPHCGFDEEQKRSGLFLSYRTLLNNQYLLGRVLGAGGFGITYLAFDVKLQCKTAVKEFFPKDLAARNTDRSTVVPYSAKESEFFDYGLDRFLMEARTMARFSHPNIVRVKNYFQANDTAYIVMDYYEGQNLGEYLEQRRGNLSERETMDIINPVLDGLQEVHQAGFLHRDIKPQNIYLTAKGTPILIDFGAARCAIGEKSRSLSIVLTPGFAPFEQYQSRGKQGAWTDIYALSATIYYMHGGKIPLAATERMNNDTLTPLNQISKKVSDSLNTAIMQGLEFHPENRPQSVRDFRNLIGNEKPLPEPPIKKKTITFLMQCISGEHNGNAIELTDQPLIIGRSPADAHLVIDNPDISRTHTKVRPDKNGRGVWVEDLGSTNGTFCETYMTPARQQPLWEPIGEPRLLKLGDCLKLGDDMDTFVIECEYSESSNLNEVYPTPGEEKNPVVKSTAPLDSKTDRINNSLPAGDSLDGVKGWLLFFCLNLTVFSPLLTAYNLVTGYNEVEPYFSQFPGLQTVMTMDTILGIALMIFSIFAGYSLWAKRGNAVSTAKKYLVTFLVYSFIASVLPFLAGLPSRANAVMLALAVVGLIRSAIYFTVWFSYLRKSRRVKATYGV